MITSGGALQLSAAALAPITSAIVDNLDILLPVGVTIMGIMVGISLIPRIVYKFL